MGFTKRQRFNFLLFTLVAIIAIAIVSCNTIRTHQVEESSSASAGSFVEKKIIRDAFGQVEIPTHPERIIVLDDIQILDPVLALGIKPIGAVSCFDCYESFRGIPESLVSNIVDVGISSQPSLERIFSLKPDLIIAHKTSEQDYRQLSTIAPTVAIDYLKLMDFKERLRYFAGVLGVNDRAEEILAQYESRVRHLREQLGKNLERKTAFLFHSDDLLIYVYSPEALAQNQILQDVGLKFTQLQQSQREFQVMPSLESIPQYDADYFFVITRDKESLSFLKQPIWSTLKAVQNKQVYAVRWDIGGPIGANRVIDDLYKYLVNTS
jgi:iron complex transport system substrate-binding protein